MTIEITTGQLADLIAAAQVVVRAGLDCIDDSTCPDKLHDAIVRLAGIVADFEDDNEATQAVLDQLVADGLLEVVHDDEAAQQQDALLARELIEEDA